MVKAILIISIYMLLLFSASPVMAATSYFTIGEAKYYIDGNIINIDVAPYIKNDK